MTSLEFKNLLDKYCRGECNREEEKLISEWYTRIDVGSHELKEEYRIIVEAKLWSKIKPQTSFIKPQVYRYKMAAAILLLAMAGAGIFYAYNDVFLRRNLMFATNEDKIPASEMKRVFNELAKPQEILLDDGSSVMLQPSSEISFPKKFDKHQRVVYLKGEAFFNVKRDTLHPFLVYSNEVVTKVLGTSFTIKAYENAKEVRVAVKTGKVSVSTMRKAGKLTKTPASEVILAPNQQAIYHRLNEEVVRELVEKPEIILPKPTLFTMHYDGASVVKIFEVLEENYGVDIVYDAQVLSACILTTSMAEEGLYERIEIICKAIGAQYEISDAKIFVRSNGCE